MQDKMVVTTSSMDEVHAKGKAFLEALAEWDGEELQGAIITDLVAKHMTTESRSQFVFQALMSDYKIGSDGKMCITREGKMFAIEFAEIIGPDNAQLICQFAKFVEKFA